MAKVLGNSKKAYVKPSNGSYTWLGGEQSNSLNRTAEAVEVTDKSSEWAQFIAGKKGATAEITVFADDNDAAQVATIAALMSGAKVNVVIGNVSSGNVVKGDSFEAIVTSINDTNDSGAVASRSISLTVTGEITRT